MSRTAILRYSNAEGPTIRLHDEIAAASETTWWGWWKKETEPFRADVLRYLQSESRARPLRLGLINRKDGEYYAATCVDSDFREDGSNFDCPEPALCPEYYRSQTLPGWFQLKDFEPLDEERFCREFGAAPQLDPTLYDVVRSDDGFDISPKPAWTMEPRTTVGRTILHLSDLHFGEFHGYAESDLGTAPGQRSLRSLLRERLGRIAGGRVGVVVISGDLTSKGDAGGFSPAKDLIDDVLDVLDLRREDAVIVAGNHDIWLEDVANPTRDYSHEKPFRDFLEGFYRREIQDLEWIQRFDAEGWDFTFVTLNSARLRTDDTREYGYVGSHRYQQMLRFVVDTLGETETERRFIAAAVHHHVLPVPLLSLPEPQRAVSLSLDAGELLNDFQRAGVGIVMHGHQHVPFLSATQRLDLSVPAWPPPGSVAVLGAGSAGAGNAQLLLGDAPFNTLSLYTPTDAGLEVVVERFTPTTPIEEFFRVTIPIHLV